MYIRQAFLPFNKGWPKQDEIIQRKKIDIELRN
jgi:hypothetical protein